MIPKRALMIGPDSKSSYWSLDSDKIILKESYVLCLLCGNRAELYKEKFFQCKRKRLHKNNGSAHPKFIRAIKDCVKVGDLEWIPKNRRRGVDVNAKIVLENLQPQKRRKIRKKQTRRLKSS